MIKIKNVSCEIRTKNSLEKYGFSHDFDDNLNVILGDNSSGKSTILSCIYYCLGMEQLLGGNKSDILDKCLWKQFDILENTYYVSESYAFLTIQNSLGNIAKIRRRISRTPGQKNNTLLVDTGERKSTLFIHSTGDHESHDGFYNWLKQFMDINLPYLEDDEGNTVKSIYLQNVMSTCLIEQTRGWSDFLAQSPFFGIRDVKTKVVEHSLGLESLTSDIQKSLLEAQQSELKLSWKNEYNQCSKRLFEHNILIDGLTDKHKPILSKNIAAKLFVKIEEGILPFLDYKTHLESEYELARKLALETNDIKTDEQSKFLTVVRNLNKQIRTIEHKIISEKYNRDSYKKIINKLDKDLENVSGIKKVGRFNDFQRINSCPVCDSNLDNPEDICKERIDIDKSLSFMKTEKSLYSTQLKNVDELIEKLEASLGYYQQNLEEQKEQLRLITDDINTTSEIKRSQIYKEIHLKQKVTEFKKIQSEFDAFIRKMMDINTNLLANKKLLDDLKSVEHRDEVKIREFESRFKSLLSIFEYKSNKINYVKIRDNYPAKLFPFIAMFDNETTTYNTQPIRLSSSASDFIRSEWAYYLSLSTCSVNHPGFLLFDEPGQHAMKMTSMKKLLNTAAHHGKQTIFAISKNLSNDNGELVDEGVDVRVLGDLFGHIESQKIKIIDIDEKNESKCIRKLD
ncbi:hypothetical protein HJ189_08715 [Vibrio parahaemolyticus]|nr:hypothetical protein [Vibrio parahaemolyticus]MBE3782244.1 hypothetical protein [Vibrio parahaemolyticus]TOM67238.1 hypothetical protein CGH73_12905 [Vibrio parahaemolyticus]